MARGRVPAAGLPEPPDEAALAALRATVWERGVELYRDFPWRNTTDPYQIWISEVMLQQTQTARVDGRWQCWLERFPSVGALAAAGAPDVLDEWQGLGYNRRALAVHRAAQAVVESWGGVLPRDVRDLTALPGIGPATAAGIRAFAYDLHAVYLETNVRAVFLHELFPGVEGVPDAALVPLVDATCPADASAPDAAPGTAEDPRSWYYALLDYGAYLKRTVPNPSRRSRGHVRQSKFEGSHRQKRAELLRILLAHAQSRHKGVGLEQAAAELSELEQKAGRIPLGVTEVQDLLEELRGEGFCKVSDGLWQV